MIISETTANGIGNQYYDEWQEAEKRDHRLGGSFFLRVARIPRIQQAVTEPGIRSDRGDTVSCRGRKRRKFLTDEQALKQKDNLTNEQITGGEGRLNL